MAAIIVDYQTEAVPTDSFFPSEIELKTWFTATLSVLNIVESLELTVRLVDNQEMTILNDSYRHKNYPTNVLSFPIDWNIPEEPRLLGDVVIAVAVVNREAQMQHKSQQAHWAHICIHGLLHLLGYDHIDEVEAEEMEEKERKILAQLGFSDPYFERE